MIKHTDVIRPQTLKQYEEAWSRVGKTESGAVIIVEDRNIYDDELSNLKDALEII